MLLKDKVEIHGFKSFNMDYTNYFKSLKNIIINNIHIIL